MFYPLGDPSFSHLDVFPSVDQFTGGFAIPLDNWGLSPQSELYQTLVEAVVMQPGWIRNPHAEQQTQALMPVWDSTIEMGLSTLDEVSNTPYLTGDSFASVSDFDPLQAFAENPHFTYTLDGIYLGSLSPTGDFQSPLIS